MRLSTLLALLCLVALGVWSQRVLERPLPGDPLRNGKAEAIDGDSLRLNGQKIRIKGIDAPEYNQTCQRGSHAVPCGREAAAALRKILARAPVTCVSYETDRYDRLLATCRSLGADIGAMMVRSGMAVSYGDYLIEEAEARNAMAGVWAGAFDMPQDWRALHRDARSRPPGRPARRLTCPPRRNGRDARCAPAHRRPGRLAQDRQRTS